MGIIHSMGWFQALKQSNLSALNPSSLVLEHNSSNLTKLMGWKLPWIWIGVTLVLARHVTGQTPKSFAADAYRNLQPNIENELRVVGAEAGSACRRRPFLEGLVEETTPHNGQKRQKLPEPNSHHSALVLGGSTEPAVMPSSPWAFGFAVEPRPVNHHAFFEFRILPEPDVLRGLKKPQQTLIERSTQWYRMVNSNYDSFKRENFDQLESNMSGPVASFAIFLSKRLTKTARDDCGRFCLKYSPSAWQELVRLPSQFFLPFLYQLLLMRPSSDIWEAFAYILANFHTQWKLIHLSEESLRFEDLEKYRKLILEKSAKMFQWISEVLLNSFAPEFIDKVTSEMEASRKMAKRPGQRPSGLRSMHPVANLFRLPRLMKTKDRYEKFYVKEKSIKQLIERWQTDCHRGYPIRKEDMMGDASRKKVGLTCPPESCLVVWNNWCKTIVKIQKAAERFDGRFSTTAAPKMGEKKLSESNMPWFKLLTSRGDGASGLASWSRLTSPINTKAESFSTSTKADMWSKAFGLTFSTKQITEIYQIPQVSIKPMGCSSDSLTKLAFFLDHDAEDVSPQFLADRLENFFNFESFPERYLSDFRHLYAGHLERLGYLEKRRLQQIRYRGVDKNKKAAPA